MTNYNFSSMFKKANIFSLSLFLISVVLISFKGLNYGIDFKGGTLIELRTSNTEASSIRDILKNMNLGDVNVKKFGKEGDFLIKWNDDGSEELTLKKYDTISIPPGVCRSFTNVGNKEGLLQVIISGGVHDMNDISFTPYAAQEMNKLEPNLSKKFEKIGFKFNAGV